LKRSAAIYLFPLALLIVVQVLFMMRDDSPLPNHALWGTDGYMRLLRVEALAETGEWFNSTIQRANTPKGDTLHWTRPFDVLLLAGAAPLIPVLGLREALYWWGVFISPVLHWLTLLALMWAARPLIPREGLVYLGIVSLAQPALLSYYAAARPDHHSLIGLLFVMLLGLILRLLTGEGSRRTALIAGVVAGLGLWVSVEFLLPIALALTAVGLAWLVHREDYAKAGRDFALGAVLVLAFGLLVERPANEELTIEYDRISVVHLFVHGMILAFWQAAMVLNPGTRKFRLGVAVLGAVAVAIAIANAFPLFFAGPYAMVDARVVAVWFKDTAEVRSLINPANPLKSLRESLFMMGPIVVAGPWLWHLIRREPPARHRGWMFITLGLVVFVPLALYQARWATYAEFLIVPAYTAVILALLARLDGQGMPLARPARLARAAARAMIVGGMTTAFLLLTVIVYKMEDRPAATPGCGMAAMSKYLATDPDLATPGKRMMTLVFFGPEILYRSQHAVVGTPYQRNTAGILDTIDFFAAVDPAISHAIARKRAIELVMLCTSARERNWYREPGSTFNRLAGDQPPDWLLPLALPDDLAKTFRLFGVKPGAN
jgi:hypothetical protein